MLKLPVSIYRALALIVVSGWLGSGTGAAELWTDPAAQHIAFPDARLTVNGLAWFKEESPSLRRLPTRLKETFPPKVWNLAAAPSGARIRFTTDSLTVAVVAQGPAGTTPVHVTAIANAGLDLYADGVYMGSVAPDAKGEIKHQWMVGKEAKAREITIYLPMGRALAVKEVVVAAGAGVKPPKPYALDKPVVYYGSSITQGIAASNPGVIYQALLSRWLNVDFVNLGFSGNGFGEPALAEAVAEVEASCYVVDYWANPPTQLYRDTLPKFIEILRAKHPQTPIIVTGPYYNPSEEIPGEAGSRQIEKRVVAREFVEARQRAGDKLIYHVDGLEMLSKAEADGLVDGRHANAMGFYFCARGLEPPLRAALGLPALKQPRK
jgi:hypothetical protein